MIYLIIAIILVAAIAPILHFLPTQRQRLIAQLRDAAVKIGLFVEFRSDHVLEKYFLSLDVQFADIIFYGLRIPLAANIERSKEIWLRDGDGWSSRNGAKGFPKILNSLPNDVLAACADNRCVGVYWTENGEVKDVENIRLTLASWVDAAE